MGKTCSFQNQYCLYGIISSSSSNNPSPIHSIHSHLYNYTFFMFSLTIPHLSHVVSVETPQKFSELQRIGPQYLLDQKNLSLHLRRLFLMNQLAPETSGNRPVHCEHRFQIFIQFPFEDVKVNWI